MNKYIGLIALGLLCATQALAQTTWEKCKSENGGSLVTIGGDTFCKSDSTMNWWSAYAWCQAMDGYMPSIAELCPGQNIVNNQKCERTYNANVWSSTVNSQKLPWHVEASNPNKIIINLGMADTWLRAFCLKK